MSNSLLLQKINGASPLVANITEAKYATYDLGT